MSITVTNPVVKSGFIANGVTADCSGCEVLVPAVVGQSIKVRQLILSNNSVGALTFTIGEDENANAVKTVLLGPISLLSGQTLPLVFNPPMELTKDLPLTVDTSGAGAICAFAQGEIQ